ncbi:MAG: sugar phosphate isomerase/epimerase [Chloroflexota bacterium]|nr:MAG: sugar phosphate isomerase/epimerase [Chloroflexota bacterium]
MTWRIGFSTGAFYELPILSVLPAIRHIGFQYVEICSNQAHLDYHDRVALEQLRGTLDGLGLRVFSLHAPFGTHIDIASPDEKARASALEQTEAAIQALYVLNGEVLVVHPAGDNPPAERDRTMLLAQSLDSLHSIQAQCAQLGLKLAIETMLPHLVGGRTAELLWLAEHLPSAGVGFCLDTGHTYLGRSLAESLTQLSSRLLLLHVHDNSGQHDDHLPPGHGQIDWASCVRTLARHSFSGALILETTASGSPEEHLRQAWDSTATVQFPGLPD